MTDSALAQLQAIHDYLAQASPDYALRIIDLLTKRSIQIAQFPFSGRMVSECDLNEVREVIEGPYRIVYLIDAEALKAEVLAVIHSSWERRKPLE